ncbi:MAG TPA: hypothetical protein VIF82_09680 [Burkholderiaceae bacterium]|jgi:hypothetical protein
MFTLLLIAGAVVCAALYRFVASLLRQIPKGNRDFNAFLPESVMDSVTSAVTGASHRTKHLDQ